MSDHDHDHVPMDQRLVDAARSGCEESRSLLSRRAFMGMSAGLFTWGYMPRCAEAAAETTGDPRLLIVQLRGGMDGLDTVVPVGDQNYQSERGDLAYDASTLLPLNNTTHFKLNPNLGTFAGWFNSPRNASAAIVHTVAPPLRNRSHFDCQDNIDTGYGAVKATSSSDGWLGRYLAATAIRDSKKQLVSCVGSVAINRMPLILKGAPRVLSWTTAATTAQDMLYSKLFNLYSSVDPSLGSLLQDGYNTDDMIRSGASRTFLDQLATGDKRVHVVNAFVAAGKLLGDDNGPRIGVLTIDNWDTHDSQAGAVVSNLNLLNDALAAFNTAVGAKWANTVVVCVSEFGRSIRPNGIRGTEHGVGTVALLAGGAVAGGKIHGNIHGDFPDLNDPEAEGGYRALNDLRAVFKGILRDHMKANSKLVEAIFEGSRDVTPMSGLIRSAQS